MRTEEIKQIEKSEHEKLLAFINDCLESEDEQEMTVSEVYQAFYKMRISQIIETIPLEQAKSIYSFALAMEK